MTDEKNGTHTTKQHDTLPTLYATLYDQHGVIDLTEAETVRLLIKSLDGSVVIARTCVVVDAVAGKVAYAWAAGDTATAASCQAEFELDFGGGLVLTVPSDTYFTVAILADLG